MISTIITVPDVWPNVPVIAINRYPLFPGFIKKVDVCLLSSSIEEFPKNERKINLKETKIQFVKGKKKFIYFLEINLPKTFVSNNKKKKSFRFPKTRR